MFYIHVHGSFTKTPEVEVKERIVDIVFHACGKAYNLVDFEHEMRLLESGAPGLRQELESIGFFKVVSCILTT